MSATLGPGVLSLMNLRAFNQFYAPAFRDNVSCVRWFRVRDCDDFNFTLARMDSCRGCHISNFTLVCVRKSVWFCARFGDCLGTESVRLGWDESRFDVVMTMLWLERLLCLELVRNGMAVSNRDERGIDIWVKELDTGAVPNTYVKSPFDAARFK